MVGGFVYQDECAQCGVFGIRHGIERLLQGDVQTAYVVCFQGVGSGYAAQGVYVPHIADAFDFGGGGAGGVFEQVAAAGVERGVVKPADGGLDLLGRLYGAVGGNDGVAARDVDVAVQRYGQYFPCGRFFGRALRGVDLGDARGVSGRQDFDFAAGFQTACFKPALIAAEVVAAAAVLAGDALDREAGGLVFGFALGGRQVFEQGQQRFALIPRGVGTGIDDVVAAQRADGDEADVGVQADLRGQFSVGGNDFFVGGAVEAEQVEFVDGDDDVRGAEQFEYRAVAFGLRQQGGLFAVEIDAGGVYQDDGGVGGGCAGNHVAGVLFVPGGVGDDEFAFRGGEVAVGDVDGDALFAFGGQAVGQAGEVGRLAVLRRLVEFGELVGQQGFAVVEQAADEGGFSVVDAAGGDEAQDGGGFGRGHGVSFFRRLEVGR